MEKEQKGWIYIFTNLINGKQYVGQTTKTFKERYRRHVIKNPKQYIDRAIKKYGIENFKIIKFQCNREDLNFCEALLCEKLNCQVFNGYNVDKPGSQHKYLHESTKDKIKKSRIGKYNKENHPNSHPKEERRLIYQKRPNCKIGRYFYKKNKIGQNNLFFKILDCGGVGHHKFNLKMNGFKSQNSWCLNCWLENNKGKNHLMANDPEKEKQLIQKKHLNCRIGKYFYKSGRLYFEIEDCGCGHHHKFNLCMHRFKMENSWGRDCYYENNRGENCYAAKTFKLISPNNEIFIIKGTLKKFCKEYNISYGSLYKILRKKSKKDNYKDWKIEYYKE